MEPAPALAMGWRHNAKTRRAAFHSRRKQGQVWKPALHLMRFMLPLIGWTNFHRNAYTTLRSPRVMLRLSRFQTLLVALRHRCDACPKARRTSVAPRHRRDACPKARRTSVAPRHRCDACPKARRTSARQHRTEPHPADPPFCVYGPNRYNIHNLQDTRMLAVRRCTADIAACVTHQEGQK